MPGLSEEEARRRLERFGPNELADDEYRNLLQVASGALREPMVLLLSGIGLIYLSLGELQEVLSLLVFLLLILAITIYQERKTEKTLGALKRLSSPRADVLRDGKRRRIPGREIVPGDVVFLSEGDRVPADMVLSGGAKLSVDESILTGEAFPVDKGAEVFAGTLVIRGHACGEVRSTGDRTEIGRIGSALGGIRQAASPLQLEARRAVRVLGGIAAVLTAFVTVFYGLTRSDWLQAVLTGLTLAMAILPNELPAVLLIFLAAGAWRISRRRVLTRRIPAVEALGGISVLCIDKTGTLTQNRMSIEMLWSSGQEIDLDELRAEPLPEEFHEVLEFGILASRADSADPMESALQHAGARYLRATEHLHPRWELLREYPLSDELLAVSCAWRGEELRAYGIGAKGAPEAIMDLCHLPPGECERITSQVRRMAERGVRVIGVAKAFSGSLPENQHDLDFEFVGLVGIADPIRVDAAAAVRECQEAGIRVLMITGDHPATARSIARQVGLELPEQVLAGVEVEGLSDLELSRRLKEVRVFCRMRPHDKLRIVKVLQESGEVVAMTGDGVNDAPALRQADVGIAMGARGTDVAREAASIVLLDDSLASIVAAIRTGRRVYRNLQNAFSYLLAVHVPITAVSILPVVTGAPLVLLPVHIAFLHLVIEPACSTVFEADLDDPSLTRQPTRGREFPILDRRRLLLGLGHGLWVAFVVMGVYAAALWRGHSAEDTRALTFTSLIMASLGLIASSRSAGRGAGGGNRPLVLVVVGSIVLLGVVLYVPVVRSLFQFTHLHLIDLAICIAAGALAIRLPGASSRAPRPAESS